MNYSTATTENNKELQEILQTKLIIRGTMQRRMIRDEDMMEGTLTTEKLRKNDVTTMTKMYIQHGQACYH